MGKLNVAVLRGGPSEEYDISLGTGARVLDILRSEAYTEKYNPIDITISKNGDWLRNGFEKRPLRTLTGVDVVFLALHGTYGEDGSVQRFLSAHNIPYTGSQSLQSAIALNKILTKDRLQNYSILMPKHMVVNRSTNHNLHGIVDSIEELIGSECIVKPVNSGSSIGTEIAFGPVHLLRVLQRSLEKYEEVLVEEYIAGREATCGVVNNYRDRKTCSLPVAEILKSGGVSMYDHETKHNNTTEVLCPGGFDADTKDKIESLSRFIHDELELSQYSRSDFIVNEKGVYFLEVNTLPELKNNSTFARSLESIGSNVPEFVTHILEEKTR